MLFRLGTRARLGLQLALTIVLAASALGNSAALAHRDHDDHDDDKAQAVHQWDAELAGLPPKAEKHRGARWSGWPRALERSSPTMSHNHGARFRLCVFGAGHRCFFDDHKAPVTKGPPYTIATFNLVDGSVGKLVKYPDGSGRVFGGYINGTRRFDS